MKLILRDVSVDEYKQYRDKDFREAKDKYDQTVGRNLSSLCVFLVNLAITDGVGMCAASCHLTSRRTRPPRARCLHDPLRAIPQQAET